MIDAVLDVVVTSWLYKVDPPLSSRDLTNWRSFAVCNDTLGIICVKSGLHKYIKHTSVDLQDDIDNFNVSEDSPPKVLGDVVEALIGAMFVDSFGNLDVLKRVIDHLIIEPRLAPHLLGPGPISCDDVANLSWGIEVPCTSVFYEMKELLDCKCCLLLSFEESTCVIKSHEQTLSIGVGRNKKESKKRACHQLFGQSKTDRYNCYLRLKLLCQSTSLNRPLLESATSDGNEIYIDDL